MNNTIRNIIAIGGGEINLPKEDGSGERYSETFAIDTQILQLTHKKTASLLFIPTASGDSKRYAATVKAHFKKIGFASVDVLSLSDESLTNEQTKSAILSHDALYVGGGSTEKMMTIWRARGLDSILKQALERGIVLSGMSAGAICWFNQGIAESNKPVDGSEAFIAVDGLGFIDAIHCPHYDVEPHRKAKLKEVLSNSNKVAICLDNCAAIEIIGSTYRIIKSKPGAQAYKAYWKNDSYFVQEIAGSDSFGSLERLLTK